MKLNTKQSIKVMLTLFLIVFLFGCNSDDEGPIIVVQRDNENYSFVFTVGEDEPNWKDFFVVTDNIDGEIIVEDTMLDTNSVNMNIEGNFVIYLVVSDSNNNESRASISVIIVNDTINPVIEINSGINNIIKLGDETPNWIDFFIITDNIDGVIDIDIGMIDISEINLDEVGVYTFYITAEDSSGNQVTKSHTLRIFDYCFIFDPETGTIEGYKYYCSLDVVIPSVIDGITVTSIEAYAFVDNYIKSVVIPETVTNINENAFGRNFDLRSVTIEGEENRFNDVWESLGFLAKFNPRNIHYQGLIFDPTNGYILGYDNSFGSEVVIPGTIEGIDVTTIGIRAFEYVNINSLIISEGIIEIQYLAFHNCGITYLELPDSLEIIGSNAFYFNRIESLIIPYGITRIEFEAFKHNYISSLVIPNSVTSIGNSAFEENRLSSINIPDSVISIEYSAFRYNMLTSITIPSSVTTIGTWAFSSNDLTSITILGDETRFNDSWSNIGFPEELIPQG